MFKKIIFLLSLILTACVSVSVDVPPTAAQPGFVTATLIPTKAGFVPATLTPSPAATVPPTLAITAPAHERIFTHSYEPATPPKGELEFEQHLTLQSGRNATAGQEDFYRLKFNEEIEYGVTDYYQLSLYFNHQYEHFKDPATGQVLWLTTKYSVTAGCTISGRACTSSGG